MLEGSGGKFGSIGGAFSALPAAGGISCNGSCHGAPSNRGDAVLSGIPNSNNRGSITPLGNRLRSTLERYHLDVAGSGIGRRGFEAGESVNVTMRSSPNLVRVAALLPESAQGSEVGDDHLSASPSSKSSNSALTASLCAAPGSERLVVSTSQVDLRSMVRSENGSSVGGGSLSKTLLTPLPTVHAASRQQLSSRYFSTVDQSGAHELYRSAMEQLRASQKPIAEAYRAVRPIFLQAAKEFNHAPSMYRLGLIEKRGYLYPAYNEESEFRNQKKSSEWFKKAADQGEPRAIFEYGCYLFNTGDSYFQGRGIEEFQRASDLGHSGATQRLVEHYSEKTIGGPLDANQIQLARRVRGLKALVREQRQTGQMCKLAARFGRTDVQGSFREDLDEGDCQIIVPQGSYCASVVSQLSSASPLGSGEISPMPVSRMHWESPL